MPKLVFEQTGKVDELLAQLNALEQSDDVVEAKQKKAGIGCGVGVLACILCVVGTVLTNGDNMALVGLLVLCVIATIAMAVLFGVYASRNLEDRRIEVAKTLLTILGKDVPAKAKCSLSVSFQDYKKHGAKTGEEGGFFASVKVSTYEDTWLQVRGTLYDGNSFRIAVKQLVKRKVKHKGKKTKVRERYREELNVTLDLDVGTYPQFAAAQKSVDVSGEVAGMSIKSVTQDDRRLRVIATTPVAMKTDDLVNGDAVLALFMHVYSALAACRADTV